MPRITDEERKKREKRSKDREGASARRQAERAGLREEATTPHRRGRPAKHQATPQASQGDASTGTQGEVQTYELTQVVSSCGHMSPPPTYIMPSPHCESHSTMDVDMESGAISFTNIHHTPSISARCSRRSQGYNSLTHSPDHNNQQRKRHKRPHLGGLLRRSHSREAQERTASTRQQMQNERFLATVQILHLLSLICPRSRSTPLSRRSSSGSISGNTYQDKVNRLNRSPNTFLEVATHQSPASIEDQHGDTIAATIPMTNTTNNIPTPTYVEINGRQIPYPQGWGGRQNPNATLRNRAVIRWENIARLIVDPQAWYDDPTMWLSMILVALNAGQRAAVIDPGYTDMWQHDQETRQQQRRLQHQGNPNVEEPPILNLSARNHAAGVVDNPDIIAIPVFMRPNHWVLGIYTRADHTIRYYDTLWAPMSSQIQRQLTAVVNEFFPNSSTPIIHPVPFNEYNRQVDSYNCGPHSYGRAS